MTCGIYVIINKLNNHKYIGQSKNIENRWWYHRNSLRKKKDYNPYLQRAWNKYKEMNFELVILEICNNDKQTLDFQEQYWLEKLKPQYNINSNVFDWTSKKRKSSATYSLSDNSIEKGTFIRPSWHRTVYGDGLDSRKKQKPLILPI